MGSKKKKSSVYFLDVLFFIWLCSSFLMSTTRSSLLRKHGYGCVFAGPWKTQRHSLVSIRLYPLSNYNCPSWKDFRKNFRSKLRKALCFKGGICGKLWQIAGKIWWWKKKSMGKVSLGKKSFKSSHLYHIFPIYHYSFINLSYGKQHSKSLFFLIY